MTYASYVLMLEDYRVIFLDFLTIMLCDHWSQI